MTREILLAALLAFPLSAVAQSVATFEQADQLAEAQRAKSDPANNSYLEAWSDFNNAHQLDERDGCYFMEGAALTQVLEIDSSGKVVGYFASNSSPSAECWKATYLGVVFCRMWRLATPAGFRGSAA